MSAAKLESWRTVDLGLRHAFHRIDEPLSLSAIAQATGYSRYHLSRLIRQTTGLSLRRYISRVRIPLSPAELDAQTRRLCQLIAQAKRRADQVLLRSLRLELLATRWVFVKATHIIDGSP